MTTFTIQDLTPSQLITDHINAPEVPRETKDALVGVLHNHSINNLPTTPEEDEAMRELFEKMGQDLTGRVPDLGVNAFETPAFSITPQHAPVPQPTQMGEPLPKSQVNPEALIEDMVAQFSISLRLLLSTVISQPKAQPETTPPEGANLQDCVEQVLTQAVWFEKMVEEQVERRVEDEVESYFQHGFDPSNYFDFNDAINNEVSDQIGDIVRDQLDDVVADKLEEVVAEKLSEASVSISF
jgi:hypothetical protein